jgi:hypothetical protein
MPKTVSKGYKKTPNAYIDLSKRKIEEGRKAMLDRFKGFNTEVADLDELVAMAAFGRSFRAEFETLNISVPEFVDDQLRGIKREIETRVADRRAARVRELKAQRDSLKTAAEKREAIEKELASLGETA